MAQNDLKHKGYKGGGFMLKIFRELTGKEMEALLAEGIREIVAADYAAGKYTPWR